MSQADLLGIDVTSEVRTLAEARLGGSWQIPAEIVRLAIGCGASEVAVRRRRRSFTFAWRDGTLQAGALAELATALDRRADGALRQRAIANLELTGSDLLLSAGALPGARLEIESGLDERTLRFRIRPGGSPSLRELAASDPSPKQEIRWSCSGLDVARATAWLATACRFAEAEVSLDGSPLPRGFASGMYHVVATRPLPCRIGLTRDGDYPVLWLLRNGIVAARAGVPGYPPFEAAVELGGLVGGAASSAELRRAVQPYVAQLVDKAVWMMVQLHDRLETVEPVVDRRLQELLLRAAGRGLCDEEVSRLPLIERLGADLRRLSLSEIAELAGRHGGRLYAVGHDEERRGLLADRSLTVVASPEVRALITELSGVRLEPPPRRLRPRLRGTVEDVSRLGRRLIRTLAGARRARPVPDHDLIDSERRLLGLLRAALAPRTVHLGAGGGEPRRIPSGWVIPRRHPVLAAAARATAVDEAWIYPLLLALALDEEPPPALRDRWRRLLVVP